MALLNLIENIISGNLLESQLSFKSVLAEKISQKLEEKKLSKKQNSGKLRREKNHSDCNESSPEKLDEISKKLIGSYLKGAATDIDDKSYAAGIESTKDSEQSQKFTDKLIKSIDKRKTGISKAVNRLTKEEFYESDLESKLAEAVAELDEAKKASPITGTHKIAAFEGNNGHKAEVRYNPEWKEYQVHHFQNNIHLGGKNISYHDTKQEAIDTAKYETGND